MKAIQQTLFDLEPLETAPALPPETDKTPSGTETALPSDEPALILMVPDYGRTETGGEEAKPPLARVPGKRGRKPRDPSLVVKKEPARRGRKSLREAAAEADLIEVPDDEQLFQKQYYTMGEVAAMFRLNHSQIRMWEGEFSILQPKKNRKGDRYFRPIDIKNLHLIYHLIRQRKFTIEGAKDYLKRTKNSDSRFEMIRSLEKIREFLLEIKAHL